MQLQNSPQSKATGGKKGEGEVIIRLRGLSEAAFKALILEGAEREGDAVIFQINAPSVAKLRAKTNSLLRLINLLVKVEEVINGG